MPPPVDLRLMPAVVVAWVVAWIFTGQREAPAFSPGQTMVVLGAAGLVLLAGQLILHRAARRRTSTVATAPSLRPTPRTPTAARTDWRSIRSWRGGVVFAFGIALLSALSATTAVAVMEDAPVAQAAQDGRSVVLTMTILTDPVATKSPDRFTGAVRYMSTLRISKLCIQNTCEPDSSTIISFFTENDTQWLDLSVGTTIKCLGKLRRTDPGNRQSALYFPVGDLEILSHPEGRESFITGLRQGLVEASTVLDGDAQALVPAIAVGEISGIGAALDDAVKVTGLSHMVAVSGSHCVVVVAVVAALLGPFRRYRVLLAIAGALAVLGLNELVRHEPSVVRATAMSIIASMGVLAGRRSRALPALGATVIVLLLADPWLARSYGFALSCAATAGLALFSEPLTRNLSQVMPRWLAALIAVPTAAQIVCSPIIVLMDPAITPYAVAANVLAGPALAPATLCSLAAMVIFQVQPWLGHAFAWLAGVPSAWIAMVAHGIAALPGTKVAWLEGAWGALALIAVSLLVVMAVSRRVRDFMAAILHPRRVVTNPQSRHVLNSPTQNAGAGLAKIRPGSAKYWWKPMGAAVVACIAVVAVIVVTRLPADSWATDDWLAVQCDVGQGDALAIRSGPESVVLIDVGPPDSAVVTCLERLGVKSVDLLILSHDHLDHVGSLEELLGRIEVRGALVPSAASTTITVLEKAGVPFKPGHAFDRGKTGEVSWTVLGPGAAPESGPVANSQNDENNDSLVLFLEVGEVRMIALGDTEESGQRRIRDQLINQGISGGVDVVKVAHHGSALQDEALAAELAPAVTLISVGLENTYGHPSQRALELYERTGAISLRTDTCGDTAIISARGRLGYLCRGS